MRPQAPAPHLQSRARRGLSDSRPRPHHGRAETKEVQRLRSRDLGRLGRPSRERPRARADGAGAGAGAPRGGRPCRASADAHREGAAMPLKLGAPRQLGHAAPVAPRACAFCLGPPSSSHTRASGGDLRTQRPATSYPGTQLCPCSLPGEGWGSLGVSDPSSARTHGQLASAWLWDPSEVGRWSSTRGVWACDKVTQGRRLLRVVGTEGMGGGCSAVCSSRWAAGACRAQTGVPAQP